MIRPPSPAAGRDGFILLFTLILLLAISAIGLATLYESRQQNAAALSHARRTQAFYAADGMMALLADEVVNGRDTIYTRDPRKGHIIGELWKTTGNYGVANFRNKVRSGSMGPGKEVVASSLGSFWRDLGAAGDATLKDDYGVRWRGFLHPPVTGKYVFYVKADDESEFFLSEDADPANLSPSPIAWNYLHMEEMGWPSQGNQPSDPRIRAVSAAHHLKGGKRYYFELYHKENGGGDFGQAGWSGPEWITEKPIPGNRLSPWSGGESPSGDVDTATFAGAAVRYRVEPIGQKVFSVSTEGFARTGSGDTVYRSPLQQKISLRAPNGIPQDTLWARVLFWDYRSDKSNPEFESPPWGSGGASPHLGIVKPDTLRRTHVDADWFGLDSIGKPIGTHDGRDFFSCGVDRWFDAWKPGDPANARKPRYLAEDPTDCTPVPAAESAYVNVRLTDSLPFIHQGDLGTSTYRFSRTGSPADSGFFWIDDRGFGREGRERNYSFCMEMHSRFLLVPGLVFDFRGDDDVWLFIDDKLVMDLGGIHVSQPATVFFDDLGLPFHRTYTFDLFYCERQTVNSNIRITTNVPLGSASSRVSRNWRRDYGNID